MEIIRNLVRNTSLLYSSEESLKLFDSLNTLAFAKGDGCKEELSKAIKKETEEISEAKKEAERLRLEIRKCDNEFADLLKEKETLEARIREIQNEIIPSEEDKEILNKHKLLMGSYKNMTGIRWDYTAPENIAKGYGFGNVKNHVHTFEYPVDGDLQNKIWQEVEKVSSFTLHDLKEKQILRKQIKEVNENVINN